MNKRLNKLRVKHLVNVYTKHLTLTKVKQQTYQR